MAEQLKHKHINKIWYGFGVKPSYETAFIHYWKNLQVAFEKIHMPELGAEIDLQRVKAFLQNTIGFDHKMVDFDDTLIYTTKKKCQEVLDPNKADIIIGENTTALYNTIAGKIIIFPATSMEMEASIVHEAIHLSGYHEVIASALPKSGFQKFWPFSKKIDIELSSVRCGICEPIGVDDSRVGDILEEGLAHWAGITYAKERGIAPRGNFSLFRLFERLSQYVDTYYFEAHGVDSTFIEAVQKARLNPTQEQQLRTIIESCTKAGFYDLLLLGGTEYSSESLSNQEIIQKLETSTLLFSCYLEMEASYRHGTTKEKELDETWEKLARHFRMEKLSNYF
jgi:hypothetical protein